MLSVEETQALFDEMGGGYFSDDDDEMMQPEPEQQPEQQPQQEPVVCTTSILTPFAAGAHHIFRAESREGNPTQPAITPAPTHPSLPQLAIGSLD